MEGEGNPARIDRRARMAMRAVDGSSSESARCCMNTPLPLKLEPGEERYTKLDGERVVFVGSHPNGLPVALSPEGWQHLRRWKFFKLSTASGRVIACGSGGVNQPAARFLVGISRVPHKAVRYRNGNGLDLRLSNLVIMPWSRTECGRQHWRGKLEASRHARSTRLTRPHRQ